MGHSAGKWTEPGDNAQQLAGLFPIPGRVHRERKKDLEFGVFLLKKAFQVRFELRFLSVKRLEQADRWSEPPRIRRFSSPCQAQGAHDHQHCIDGRGDDADNAQYEQEMHHALVNFF